MARDPSAAPEARPAAGGAAGGAAERAERHVLTVAPEEAGERVDRLLSRRLPALSRARLKRLIEAGALALDGAPLRSPSAKPRAGQVIALEVPPAEAPEPEGQAIPLAIVYEDEALIVVDKPAGLVVHPAPGNPDRTLVNALIAHCGPSLKGVGGVRRPGIVHRLDKDTSGLIVAAKSDAAHQGLVAQFAARRIERQYACLVWGRPEPAAGEIVGNIGRSPRNRKKMAVLSQGGRPAVTRYHTLGHGAGGAVSRLACRLETGRTHQIRVHLAHRGHPLLGDPLYGRETTSRRGALPAAARAALAGLGRQALHAESLGFSHPLSRESLTFTSPLPKDLKDLTSFLEFL